MKADVTFPFSVALRMHGKKVREHRGPYMSLSSGE